MHVKYTVTYTNQIRNNEVDLKLTVEVNGRMWL